MIEIAHEETAKPLKLCLSLGRYSNNTACLRMQIGDCRTTVMTFVYTDIASSVFIDVGRMKRLGMKVSTGDLP